jgi:hypothetical protein
VTFPAGLPDSAPLPAIKRVPALVAQLYAIVAELERCSPAGGSRQTGIWLVASAKQSLKSAMACVSWIARRLFTMRRLLTDGRYRSRQPSAAGWPNRNGGRYGPINQPAN